MASSSLVQCHSSDSPLGCNCTLKFTPHKTSNNGVSHDSWRRHFHRSTISVKQDYPARAPRQSRSAGPRYPRQRIAVLPAQLPARSRAAVPPRHLAAAAGEKPQPIPAVLRAARGRSGTGRGFPKPPLGPGTARGKEIRMEPTWWKHTGLGQQKSQKFTFPKI